MPQRMSYTVQGRVQGVFFRDFTQEKASSYGLTGWVKNVSNGDVQIEAQGSEDSLRKLRKDINDGPKHAHVIKVIEKEIDVKEGEEAFQR